MTFWQWLNFASTCALVCQWGYDFLLEAAYGLDLTASAPNIRADIVCLALAWAIAGTLELRIKDLKKIGLLRP